MERLLITGIVNGRIADLEQFQENCKSFEGKKVDIIIRNHVTKRTNPQNRYWRGVVIPLITNYINSFGNEVKADDIHESYIYKGYFGFKEVNGEMIPKRSSEADTFEFSEAISRVQREWAEKGLVIPDPNQQEFLEETA